MNAIRTICVNILQLVLKRVSYRSSIFSVFEKPFWTENERSSEPMYFFFTVYNLTLWCALSLKYCSKVSGMNIITSLNWDVCPLITYIKMSSSCVKNNVNVLPLVNNPTYFAISIRYSFIKPSIDLCIWLNILNFSLT